MTDSPLQDILRRGSAAFGELLREARDAGYEDGHKDGFVAGRASVVESFQDFANQITAATKEAAVTKLAIGTRANRPVALKDDRPATGYGAISAAITKVMREAPRQGLLIVDVVGRANSGETKMSVRQVREALKRLKNQGLVDCKKRRKWVALDKLRGPEVANENGALNGQAASAPSAGEGSDPSPNRQQALGLNG